MRRYHCRECREPVYLEPTEVAEIGAHCMQHLCELLDTDETSGPDSRQEVPGPLSSSDTLEGASAMRNPTAPNDSPAIDSALTRVIARHMAERNLTPAELARLSKVSPATLTRRLNGGDWMVPELQAVAEVLGADGADLLAEAGEIR